VISKNKFKATSNIPIPGILAINISNMNIFKVIGAIRTSASVLLKLKIINKLNEISITFNAGKKPEVTRILKKSAAGPAIGGIGKK
jgi:hypothetical protein